MAGHFEAIGIDDWRSFAEYGFVHGEWQALENGGRTVIFRDVCGASVVVWTTADDQIADVAPSFSATSHVPVRNASVCENAEFRYSSVVSAEIVEGSDVLYPILTALENVHELLGDQAVADSAVLSLTAFAEEVNVWEDESAYDRVESDTPKMASRSFVPSGMFVERPEDLTAQALITGSILECKTLRNAHSGREFVHAVASTYGMDVDMVFSPNDLPAGLAPGSLVQGTFWLMGRLHLG